MMRIWKIRNIDDHKAARLAREASLPAVLARILVGRGISGADEARIFLEPRLSDLHDPLLMHDMDRATERLLAARKRNEKILLFGDYDVDGVTATSLLWQCLRLAGGSVDYYIPDRLEEGYGLNCDALRRLHEQDPDRLVVSVDCGIASVEEAVPILKQRPPDWKKFALLLDVNQGMMQALGVVTASLAEAVRRLRDDPGILGAKVSGAGGGDCVIGLGDLQGPTPGLRVLDVRAAPEGLQWHE